MTGSAEDHQLNVASLAGRITRQPELNVLLFAFLLNYPWEFLQVPFFQSMAEANHWDAILFCTRATGGDALISLFSFWVVTAVWRNRWWVCRPTVRQLAVFISVGLLVTFVLEWHATEIAQRWAYADHMPVLPILGTGVLPVMQWILLPLLVVWLVRRQIAH